MQLRPVHPSLFARLFRSFVLSSEIFLRSFRVVLVYCFKRSYLTFRHNTFTQARSPRCFFLPSSYYPFFQCYSGYRVFSQPEAQPMETPWGMHWKAEHQSGLTDLFQLLSQCVVVLFFKAWLGTFITPTIPLLLAVFPNFVPR